MYIYKSEHNGISFDFVLPEKSNKKLVVLLPGLPEYPRPKDLMIKLARKGYLAVYPKYRGTFESDGSFLEKSPAHEVLEIINHLRDSDNLVELFAMKEMPIKFNEIIVLASSFGGSVGLHLSKLTNKVKRFVLIAPVIEFESHNRDGNEQDLKNLLQFIKKGYNFIYRLNESDYTKMLEGKIIPSALKDLDKYSGEITIIHCKDDFVVSLSNSVNFVEKCPNAKLIKLKNKGHFSISRLDDKLMNEILK